MITINSSEYAYVYDYSDYNHRYFRNVKTNEILLEKVGYVAGYNLYYNIGTNPTYSIEDITPDTFLGFSEKINYIEVSKIVNIDNFANYHG